METYVALLRGINVSGQKKIHMADLKLIFEDLGYTNVETYIQSGNVVFDAESALPEQVLAETITSVIAVKYGFSVPVLVQSAKKLHFAYKHNPYLTDKALDTAKMHLTFLYQKPGSENLLTLKGLTSPPPVLCNA